MQSPVAIRYYSILILSATLVIGCPRDVPVAELSDARAEIERAESIGASEFASDEVDRARSDLMEAHALIASEKFAEAKSRAQSSYDHALLAQERAAPAYAERLRGVAESSISSAVESNADEFAAEEIALARRGYDEGISLLNGAKAATEARTAARTLEERKGAILEFRDAAAKFQNAESAAKGARSRSLGMADELRARAANARQILERARVNDAERLEANDFQIAKMELAAGEKNIELERLKEASMHIAASERAAASALMNALSDKAAKYYDRANRLLSASKGIFAQERGALPADTSSTLEDYVRAAEEALDASRRDLETRDYETSIGNAEEAENLAHVIEEQIRFAKEAAIRSTRATLPSDLAEADADADAAHAREAKAVESIPEVRVAEQPKTDTTGWRSYTVKKTKPAECLWRIAAYKIHYGDGRYWRRIYEANRNIIQNPNRIKPGMVLKIPPSTAPAGGGSHNGDGSSNQRDLYALAVGSKRGGFITEDLEGVSPE
jgi:nucleoid-associated protein YgaU